MIVDHGVRIGWVDLPMHMRSGVEALLGSPVVQFQAQVGGFSPGSADRVRTREGRRAFVKAVSAQANERSPLLHRREAEVTAALPPDAPVPRLLGVHDDGTWVALVLTDVEGRHPHLPWRDDELAAVQEAYAALAAVALGDALPTLPTITIPGLPRPGAYATTGPPDPARGPTVRELTEAYDPALVSLLVPGMVER